MFYGHSDVIKIRISMSRLLTIVNERKKLRNEYRKVLEDEYINLKKKEEKVAEVERIEKLREQGIKTEFTEEENIQRIKKKNEAIKLRLSKSLDSLKSTANSEDTATASIQEVDLKLISQTKNRLSQKEILKMYVKNYSELDLKQRR